MEVGLLSEVKTILKSLIVSSPTQITVAQLNQDYRDFEGQFIPFRRLGFSCLDNFLQSIPDTLRVRRCGGTNYVISVSYDKSKHIRDMIMQQKPPSNGKSGRRRRNKKQSQSEQGTPQPACEQKQSKPNQFSPFEITKRNVSVRTVGVRDITADKSQLKPNKEESQAPFKTNGTRPQNSGIKMQNSANKENQIKPVLMELVEAGAKQVEVEIKSAKPIEANQNLIKPKKCEEIELLQKLLNTTCHVTQAAATSFLFDMKESPKKATVRPRTLQLLSQLNCGTLNETKEKENAEIKDKDLLKISAAEITDFDAAVPEFALVSPDFRINFPKYTVPYGSKIPPFKMPDNVDVDSCIGVYIAEIQNPFKFWFHIDKEEGHELDLLMNGIKKFYHSLDPHELRLPNAMLVSGQVCAVNFNDIWHRAEIVGFPVDDNIKVCLVDYGTVTEVNIKEVKYLVACFADVPVQAMRGCLSHIKPCGRRWSHDASKQFLYLVKARILFAKISAIDEENMMFYMVLCDTNGGIVKQVNNDLINIGYAVYNEDWQEEREVIEFFAD